MLVSKLRVSIIKYRNSIFPVIVLQALKSISNGTLLNSENSFLILSVLLGKETTFQQSKQNKNLTFGL